MYVSQPGVEKWWVIGGQWSYRYCTPFLLYPFLHMPEPYGVGHPWLDTHTTVSYSHSVFLECALANPALKEVAQILKTIPMFLLYTAQ